jgi:ATP-binding cassette subfamily F protein uup
VKFQKATALLIERQEALAMAEAQWLELEEKASG